MNFAASALTWLVPSLVFALNFAVLSFSWRHQRWQMCWLLVLCTAVFAATCAVMAYTVAQTRKRQAMRALPWYTPAAMSICIAWVCSVTLGLVNYQFVSRWFYDITGLEVYRNVDPARESGIRLADAGRVLFTEGSRVGVSQAYASGQNPTYCVAPIVSDVKPHVFYDFWAAGLDCCAADGSGFHCGNVSDSRTHAGLRVVSKRQNEYFRRVAEDAMRVRGMQSTQPLFFQWTADPAAEVAERQDRAVDNFVYGTFAFLSIQLFIVVLVAVRAGLSRSSGW